MVDLLRQHHDRGRRFEPTEFLEERRRVAVGMTLTDPSWGGESATVFKVFTFDEGSEEVVLLQDCTGRDDALSHLASE